MRRSALERGRSLLIRRRFSECLDALEPAADYYKDSFDYQFTGGLACLYLGDMGSAGSYFQRARYIRMSDVNLLNAQAVMHLRRGDTDRAVQYYLETLEHDPDNKLARRGLNFIRTKGTSEQIGIMIDTGEIEKLYPSLGLNPDTFLRTVFCSLIGIVLAVVILNFIKPEKHQFQGSRINYEDFNLTAEEMKINSSDVQAQIPLTQTEAKNVYFDALEKFENNRDNAAQVEVNKILNSNASEEMKDNAKILATHFVEPDFSSLKDNFDYAKVLEQPLLYNNCWVAWSGRVSSVVVNENKYECKLYVGYEDKKEVKYLIRVEFNEMPAIDVERPVHILGKLVMEKNISTGEYHIYMVGKSFYQPKK